MTSDASEDEVKQASAKSDLTEQRSSEEVSAQGSSSFAVLLAAFRRKLESALDGYLAEEAAATEIHGSASREITDPLRDYVARGGKRLRPALVHFSYRAAGGTEDRTLPVEMAVELLHTYLLIHDDIMDRAETRRGEPAAHRIFAEVHRRSHWAGDPERHGEAVAILLGDLAHSHAVSLFLSSAASAHHDTRVSECFAEMCREVVVGQYLEMTAPQRENLQEDELLTILRLKSGRYSVERPIQLGALLAGASAALLGGLSTYGAAVGEAFQLQDDLLGVFGDREEVGKPVGSDLVEGKYTVLIHTAMEMAGDSERKAILECLRRESPGTDEVARVRDIVDRVGAREQVETMVRERLDRSAEELGRLALAGEAAVFFAGLIDYLRERRS